MREIPNNRAASLTVKVSDSVSAMHYSLLGLSETDIAPHPLSANASADITHRITTAWTGL